MLGDRVVVPVIDHPELPQDIAPDDSLYRPIVALLALALAVQSLDVEDLGAEPLEDDADVFDAEVVLLVDRQLVDQQQEFLRGHDLVLHYRVLRLGLGAVVLLMVIVMVVMQVEAGAGQARARLLVGGVAEAHVTFAQARSLGAVRQGGRRLGRRRLRLRLLLVVVRVLVLLVLRVLNRRGRDRLVHGDPAALLVQGAAVEVALADGATVGPVHRTAVPRDRLVDVIGALGRVNVNGRAVERVGALLHQAARHGVRLRRLLLLLLGQTQS